MHLPLEGKNCVSNGNTIEWQWLVGRSGTSQKEQWFQEARRQGKYKFPNLAAGREI
jgi:hypothetical protein